MPASELFRRFTRRATEDVRSMVVGAGISKALPLVGTVATALLGVIGKEPLMYVAVATFSAFATLSVGIFFFYQLIFQRSPKSKLAPVQPQLNSLLTKKDDKTIICGVRLGMLFMNNAIFPIDYKVKNILSVVDGRVNTRTLTKEPVAATVYPGIPAGFLADAVPIEIESDRVIECALTVTVEYGRVGHLHYRISKKFKMSARIGPESIIAQLDWSHAD